MVFLVAQKPFVFPFGQIPSIKLHYNRVAHNTFEHLWIVKNYCNITIDNKITSIIQDVMKMIPQILIGSNLWNEKLPSCLQVKIRCPF